MMLAAVSCLSIFAQAKAREPVNEIYASDNDAFGKAIGKMVRENKKAGSGAQAAADPYYSARLIVKGKKSNLKFDSYGAVQVIRSNSNVYLVQFETSKDARIARKALAAESKVIYVEPDAYMGEKEVRDLSESVNRSMSFRSWGVEHINADKYAAYLKKKKAGSITVAVVDTGVSSHSLIGNRLLKGYDFVDGDSAPADEHSHGTHVAGTIVDCTPGLKVNILPVRVLDENGGGTNALVGAGVTYAADHGAKVINLSLGGGHSNYLDECITYAIKKGVVVCVAAGNDYGRDTSSVCPAHMERAVVVGAVDSYDQLASFSNVGSSVDVVAPGVDIVSSIPGGSYGSMDGTSMATPHVAACAAMYRLAYPAKTVAQIETLIRKNTNDLGDAGKDRLYGAGVVYMKVPKEKNKTVSPTSVSLNKTSVSLNLDQTIVLTASVSPSNATNKTVTWKSSVPAVATVSGGKITPKKAGTTVITAATVNGKKAACKVTVKKARSIPSGYVDVPTWNLFDEGSAAVKTAVSLDTGVNKLRVSKGYVKFKAPATGTYQFTFSNLKKTGGKAKGDYSFGYVSILKYKSGWFSFIGDIVETQYGKTDCLPISSEYAWKIEKKNYSKDELDETVHMSGRYGRLKLTKGKTLYFHIDVADLEDPTITCDLTLTVKKKN